MDNTTTGITTKVLFAVLFAVLFVNTFPAAAQESMIPDDFDWSTYMQYWENDWNNWNTNQQPDYNYYQPQPDYYFQS